MKNIDIAKIDDLVQTLYMAREADLESGAAWLNEEAHAEFARRYPSLCKAINELAHYVNCLLPEPEWIVEGRG